MRLWRDVGEALTLAMRQRKWADAQRIRRIEFWSHHADLWATAVPGWSDRLPAPTRNLLGDLAPPGSTFVTRRAAR